MRKSSWIPRRRRSLSRATPRTDAVRIPASAAAGSAPVRRSGRPEISRARLACAREPSADARQGLAEARAPAKAIGPLRACSRPMRFFARRANCCRAESRKRRRRAAGARRWSAAGQVPTQTAGNVAESCLMSDTKPWAFDESLQPREDEVGFDLARALDAVVLLRAEIPEDAFTGGILGTERVRLRRGDRRGRAGAHHRLSDHRGRDHLAYHQRRRGRRRPCARLRPGHGLRTGAAAGRLARAGRSHAVQPPR